EIAEMSSSGTSREMARRLLDRAVERGAPDNVTVSVVTWRKSHGDQKSLSIAAHGKVVARPTTKTTKATKATKATKGKSAARRAKKAKRSSTPVVVALMVTLATLLAAIVV